jgi:hypothetical protein
MAAGMMTPRIGLPIAVAMIGCGLNMILISPSLPGLAGSLAGRVAATGEVRQVPHFLSSGFWCFR